MSDYPGQSSKNRYPHNSQQNQQPQQPFMPNFMPPNNNFNNIYSMNEHWLWKEDA